MQSYSRQCNKNMIKKMKKYKNVVIIESSNSIELNLTEPNRAVIELYHENILISNLSNFDRTNRTIIELRSNINRTFIELYRYFMA